MTSPDITAKTDTHTVTFSQFLPGLFRFIKKLPRLIPVIKKAKGMALDDIESIGKTIEGLAVQYADNPALLFEAETYSYHELNEQANRVANTFLAKGISKGDVVIVLLDNRPQLLFCIVGLAKIGAIASLINPNLRGAVLEHCVTIEPTRTYIIDEELVDAFEEIRPALNMPPSSALYFATNRGSNPAPEGYLDLNRELEGAETTNPPTTLQMQAQDPFCFIFTSGTTGKPKAAIMNNQRWIGTSLAFGAGVGLKPGDVTYIPLPFCHSTALATVWGPAMTSGAVALMRRKFSASNFWKDVREYGVTAFGYVGELCRYLINQPPQPEEKDNTVTKMLGNGLRPDIWKAFKKRFGISVVQEFYAASEGNIAFVNMMNLDCTVGIGFAPYVLIEYDVDSDEPVRGADGFLKEAGKGEAGLLLGKIDEKNRFIGYTNKEASEKKILRDVLEKGDAWFNTGDLFKNIGYKHAQFVDRVGDTFRWKGENVSTTEVEEMVDAREPVKESTVYGVRIPGTDGRAGMVSIISSTPLEEFDFKTFATELRKGLPSYAVPIFLRFQEAFEITATMKRIKARLQEGGFNPDEVKDPLFVMLPGTFEYTELTPAIYTEIEKGAYRF
jgi:citronellyl-CoA synthetase